MLLPRVRPCDIAEVGVVIASHEPIDTASLAAAAESSAHRVRIVAGDELPGLIGDATFLSDDYAPVDQLIGR